MRDREHHPFRHDFDVRHREAMDRMARTRNVITLIIIMIGLTAAASVIWLLSHPEQIGSFIGRIASGFSEAGGHS